MVFTPNYPATSGSLDSLPIRENFDFLKNSLDTLASGSYINVKDFGAVGDGVSDDTVAIQNALDAAIGGNNGRSIVFFPTGTYNVTSPLLLSIKGVTVKGASSIESIIKYEGVVSDFVLKTSGSINNFGIRDLCIEGNNVASGGIKLGDAPWVIDENNVWQFRIEDVLIKNFSAPGSIGIYLLNISHGYIEQVEIISINGTASKLEATNNNTGVVEYNNCKFGGYPGSDLNYAIELVASDLNGVLLDSVAIIECFIRGAVAGIRCARPIGVIIYQNHIECAIENSSGILMEGGRGIHIAANVFGAIGGTGVSAIKFTREGETRGISIEANHGDQFDGTDGSYLVNVASSGYILQDVVYSPFSTASSVEPLINDSDKQLAWAVDAEDGGTNVYLNKNHVGGGLGEYVGIYFGNLVSGSEYLVWDEYNQFFTFSKEMRIEGNLSCKGSIFSLNNASDYTDVRIYFNDPFGGDTAYLRYETAYHNMSLGGNNPINFFNSGWLKSETDVRSKYHMSLNVENINQDAELRFYKPTSGYETLKWNKTTGRFEFSDNLYVDGTLEVSGSAKIGGPLELVTLRLGASAYTTIQDVINTSQCAGRISGAIVSGSATPGKVQCTAGTGFIKISDSAVGETKFFIIPATDLIDLTDNSINYILAQYNGGIPQVVSEADFNNINFHDEFVIGYAYASGSKIDILDAGNKVADHDINNCVRLFYRGPERMSGGTIGEKATRYVTTTDGIFYLGDCKIITSVFDSSAENFEHYFYLLNGNWADLAATGQINNLQYNNVSTPGSEVLANLNPNRYGVHWVYICFEGDLNIILGRGDYTLAQANTAQPPGDIPDYLSKFAILAGKIIIKRSATAFTSTESAFVTPFVPTAVIEHNDLANIDGGTTDEYYHLENVEHGALVDGGSADGYHTHPASGSSGTDTLDSVCDRGATTDQAITVSSSGSVLKSLRVQNNELVGGNLEVVGNISGKGNLEVVGNIIVGDVSAIDIIADSITVNQINSGENYLIEDISVTDVSCQRNPNYLVLPSPYSPSQTIHPRVLYFPNKWNDYYYWMTYAPGDTSAHENPCILASQDGQTWVVPAGGSNPIDPLAPQNSDPELIMGYDGLLYCMWRWNNLAQTGDIIYIKSSSDGITWSAKTEVCSGSYSSLLSPSLEKNNGTYYMWVVDGTVSPNVLNRYTSSDLLTFTFDQQCSGSISGRDLWHLRFLKHGQFYYGLMVSCTSNTGGSDPHLHFCKSHDGIDWEYNDTPLMATGTNTDWDKNPYTASPLWIIRGHQYKLAMWYSAWSNSMVWQTGYTEISLDPLIVESRDRTKIGINKANPQYTLDIEGSIYATENLRINGNASVTGSIQLGGDLDIVGNAAVTGSIQVGGNADINGQEVDIGVGANNVVIYADQGGAAKPGLKYNTSLQAWQFSNDGITWIALAGSGSGGNTYYSINRAINLPIAGAILPSGSAPGIEKVQNSSTNPAIPYFMQADFDATTAESMFWSFRMPADFGTNLRLAVQYKMASATTGGIVFGAYMFAVISGSAGDVDAKAFDAVNYGNGIVPGTAGYLSEIEILMVEDDDVSAGAFVCIDLKRFTTRAYDTATGDAEVVSVQLKYEST